MHIPHHHAYLIGNPNQFIEAHVYKTTDAQKAIDAIRQGEHEALIIDADLKLPFPGASMVNYWNFRVKEEYRVPVPLQWSDMNKKVYRQLPGFNSGMWHTYATKAHDAVLDSPVIDSIFTAITGTKDWQVHPNRLRVNGANDDKGYEHAHLEGQHVLRATTGVSAIVCVTKGRTFTYYKGSNNHQEARALFRKKGGIAKSFVSLTQDELKGWQRTTITTTKPGQIILFADSVAHEVSRWGKYSISLFMSPYDPRTCCDENAFYQNLSTYQANKKRKNTKDAPPLPISLMTAGQRRQFPQEYTGLTFREAEVLGSLFHSTGARWPSGKPVFFLMHMMAMGAYKKKLLPFCFKYVANKNKTENSAKYNYEFLTDTLLGRSNMLPSNELVKLVNAGGSVAVEELFHALAKGEPITAAEVKAMPNLQVDQPIAPEKIHKRIQGESTMSLEHFHQQLPFYNSTAAEVESLKAQYTGIPAIAFDLCRYWTKNPTTCSKNVCLRRGYIKAPTIPTSVPNPPLPGCHAWFDCVVL